MQKSWILWIHIKTALFMFVILALITGILYPFLMTGFASVFFHDKANGSLIKRGDKVIGSELIGQYFSDPHYFWGRPSATTPFPYNGAASKGSNYGPRNPIYLAIMSKRITALTQYHKADIIKVPIDLVTSSGSGLDPHISPYAAFFQSERIAAARNLPQAAINQLIHELTAIRIGGILGEGHINVLQLNLALDAWALEYQTKAPVSE